MNEFPRSTGAVEIDRPTGDVGARFLTIAQAAQKQKDEESGKAEADRKARERLEREAIEENLARAPEHDRKILEAERKDLARATAAVGSAEAAAAQARESIVTARAAGRTSSSRILDATDGKLAKAKRDRAIAADIVERLESRMVAAVRADRAKRAQAELDAIHDRQRVAASRILAALDAADEWHRLHAAEEAAARELAAANGALPWRWSVTHEAKLPVKGFGAEHVRSTDVEVSIALDGNIADRATIASRLGS